MQQLMRDFFSIVCRDCSLLRIFRREIDEYPQQTTRGSFQVDQFVTHAGDSFFNQIRQLHDITPLQYKLFSKKKMGQCPSSFAFLSYPAALTITKSPKLL